MSCTLPEVLFFAFRMTFAIITLALIVGVYVERVEFAFVMTQFSLWTAILCTYIFLDLVRRQAERP